MTFAELHAVVREVDPLARRFREAGHRLYLVGGIVRDLWLDREVRRELDLDLTTDAMPDEIKSLVGPVADALWLQGERFGTVGARIADRAYEITTHRADSYVAHSRKPAVEFSTAIDEDLSRRDFTVNAMAVELPEAHLVDPFGGATDLAERRLRTPLDPEVSFTDDPLRMLRAARFVAGYGLEPTPRLIDAMRSLRIRLDIVSAERVRDELDKLLSVDDPGAGLALLSATGLLERFLPEVDEAHMVERSPALAQLSHDPELRLAALVFGTEPARVESRMAALRFATDRRRATVATLEAAGDLAAGGVVDAPSLRRWVAAAGPYRFDARTIVAALVPGGAALVTRSLELESELEDDVADMSLPLTGREVMAVLGVGAGPTVGDAMDHLRELRFELGPLTAEAARAHLATWWEQRTPG